MFWLVVAGGVLHGACGAPWLLVVSSLVAGGGWWFPGGWCRWSGPRWWLVVHPGIIARIFTAGHVGGYARQLLRDRKSTRLNSSHI